MSLGRSLRSPFLSAVIAAATLWGTTGCGGCGDPELVCDDSGACFICDGFGCEPADPRPGSGVNVGATTATGSAGGGVGGQGGAGGAGGTGGSAPCDPELTTCGCETSAECAATPGTQCIGGLCVAGCDFSYECGSGKVCANGACVEGCGETAPCEQAGTKCEKGVCVPDPAKPECAAAGDCDGGQICAGGFCTTGCDANSDCADGQICNAATGACVPDPSPKPGCDATVTCTGAGQVCADDGYCHYPCADTNACKLIDNRFVACEGGFCRTPEEVDPECSLSKPCPEGQDCISNQCL